MATLLPSCYIRFRKLNNGNTRRTRKRTRTKLEEIRDLRNDVFHFKRELMGDDLDILTAHRDWLFRRARIVEARRKVGIYDGAN